MMYWSQPPKDKITKIYFCNQTRISTLLTTVLLKQTTMIGWRISIAQSLVPAVLVGTGLQIILNNLQIKSPNLIWLSGCKIVKGLSLNFRKVYSPSIQNLQLTPFLTLTLLLHNLLIAATYCLVTKTPYFGIDPVWSLIGKISKYGPQWFLEHCTIWTINNVMSGSTCCWVYFAPLLVLQVELK